MLNFFCFPSWFKVCWIWGPPLQKVWGLSAVSVRGSKRHHCTGLHLMGDPCDSPPFPWKLGALSSKLGRHLNAFQAHFQLMPHWTNYTTTVVTSQKWVWKDLNVFWANFWQLSEPNDPWHKLVHLIRFPATAYMVAFFQVLVLQQNNSMFKPENCG